MLCIKLSMAVINKYYYYNIWLFSGGGGKPVRGGNSHGSPPLDKTLINMNMIL